VGKINKKGRPHLFGEDVKKISVLIDPQLKKALDAVTTYQRTTISDFVRRLIINNEQIKEELK